MDASAKSADSQDSAAVASGWRMRVRRAGLLAAMTVLTLNLFTGSPLLSLWIGSRVQGPGHPSMEAFLAFAASFGVFSFVLVRMVAVVGRAHDSLIGQRPTVRTHVPWLRSMRGERPLEVGRHGALSALDVILVSAVVLAAVAFELWFFFKSGSPIDERSGRGR